MLVKVRKRNVEKIVQCDAVIMRRVAFPRDDHPDPQSVGQVWMDDLDAPAPEGCGTALVLDFKPEGVHGSYYVREEPPNRVFIMNDAGDTFDRRRWD